MQAKNASPMECRVALVMLDMGWWENAQPPNQEWQLEEIYLCCEGAAGKLPTRTQIAKGWQLAQYYALCPQHLAARAKEVA